jgi:hypothetical protein
MLSATGAVGEWIRPVSAREHEEVSEEERRYSNGVDPKILDIIEAHFLEARPKTYQSENWLLDPAMYWAKAGRISWDDLRQFADASGALWTNVDSSYQGLNDRVAYDQAQKLKDSLKLVHVETVSLRVFKPGEAFGDAKRRVQAKFEYGENKYWLWITDPEMERRYLAKEDGEYRIGESYVTVSLGEPYKDYCYKLVAAIIERTRWA